MRVSCNAVPRRTTESTEYIGTSNVIVFTTTGWSFTPALPL
jgi:hypothetical protein